MALLATQSRNLCGKLWSVHARLCARAFRIMATAVFQEAGTELGQIFALRLPQLALGRLAATCRACRNWAEDNGRRIRLMMHHPRTTSVMAPMPHKLRPLTDGPTSKPVPWIIPRQKLYVEPHAVTVMGEGSSGTAGPEVLLWEEASAIDRARTTVRVELLNYATKDLVLPVLYSKVGFLPQEKSPGKIYLYLTKLSSHYTPRMVFQLRVVVGIALRDDPHIHYHIAMSEPLNVVSAVPSAKSIAASKRRAAARRLNP